MFLFWCIYIKQFYVKTHTHREKNTPNKIKVHLLFECSCEWMCTHCVCVSARVRVIWMRGRKKVKKSHSVNQKELFFPFEWCRKETENNITEIRDRVRHITNKTIDKNKRLMWKRRRRRNNCEEQHSTIKLTIYVISFPTQKSVFGSWFVQFALPSK